MIFKPLHSRQLYTRPLQQQRQLLYVTAKYDNIGNIPINAPFAILAAKATYVTVISDIQPTSKRIGHKLGTAMARIMERTVHHLHFLYLTDVGHKNILYTGHRKLSFQPIQRHIRERSSPDFQIVWCKIHLI